jgi:hypothetical protein
MALGNAEENLPRAMPFLMSKTPSQRAKFAASFQKDLGSARNEADRQLDLTEILSFVGGKAVPQGGAGLGARLHERLVAQQFNTNNAITAGRSFSPRCNVYTGASTSSSNMGYCHPQMQTPVP